MRIALALEYPISLRGGVSVLVETLLKEFARRNHEILLVSPDSASSLNHSPSGPFVHKHFPWDPAQPPRQQAAQLAAQLADAGVQLAHFHLGGTYGFGNRFPGRCPISHLHARKIPC